MGLHEHPVKLFCTPMGTFVKFKRMSPVYQERDLLIKPSLLSSPALNISKPSALSPPLPWKEQRFADTSGQWHVHKQCTSGQWWHVHIVHIVHTVHQYIALLPRLSVIWVISLSIPVACPHCPVSTSTLLYPVFLLSVICDIGGQTDDDHRNPENNMWAFVSLW